MEKQERSNSVLDRACDGCGAVIESGRYRFHGDDLLEALCRECLGGDIVEGERADQPSYDGCTDR